MAHSHAVIDTDPHFTVDPDSRMLTYMSPEKLTIIHNDHNSERITFDLPKEIDGHDMTLCNRAQVHFINIDANDNTRRRSGIYNMTDVQVVDGSPDTISCSWLVSKDATSLVGTLHFVLRFACMEGSRVTYAWHTSVYTGISISQSIDNTETIVDEYIETLQEWYNELISAGTTGVNVVAEATDEALAKIGQHGGVSVSDVEPTSPDVKVWVKPVDSSGHNLWVRNTQTGVFEPIVTVMGSAGEPINITHDTGGDYYSVMSQYQVTNELSFITEGCLEMRLADDGLGYIVYGIRLGSQLHGTDIIIPDTYKGLPVVAFDERFLVYAAGMGTKSIVVPNSVTNIYAHEEYSSNSSLRQLKVLNLSKLDHVLWWPNPLYDASSDLKILVKDELLSTWVDDDRTGASGAISAHSDKMVGI